ALRGSCITIAESNLEHPPRLLALKGQKTAKAWPFLRRLDLEKAGFRGRSQLAGRFFAAHNGENSGDAQGVAALACARSQAPPMPWMILPVPLQCGHGAASW